MHGSTQMPSLPLNRRLWSSYDWRQAGEEWSVNWGNTGTLWHGTLMPRIASCLGPVRVVELGPGYGRLTSYLKDHCASLVLVDIAANCIDFCCKRFAQDSRIEYVVGDGRSLEFLADGSVDFVFSFDSLVHADLDVITAYLGEIERVIKVGGRAFLHHSNLAAAGSPAFGTGDHLRARDVSAERVRDVASKLATLHCQLQELISWDESSRLLDCIST